MARSVGETHHGFVCAALGLLGAALFTQPSGRSRVLQSVAPAVVEVLSQPLVQFVDRALKGWEPQPWIGKVALTAPIFFGGLGWIGELLRLVRGVLVGFFQFLVWCVHQLGHWLPSRRGERRRPHRRGGTHHCLCEHRVQPVPEGAMALEVAQRGPVMGRFYLHRRGAEWDEVLMVCPAGGQDYLVCTTDPDAAAWQWGLVRYMPDQYKLVQGLGGTRRPFAGVEDDVGWLCDPQDVVNKWGPQPADVLRLTREAERDDLVVVPGADGGQLSALTDAIARPRLPVRGQAGTP